LAAAPSRAILIAHWAADGNVLDSAGSHHGALINGATFGAGKFGQAFSLNGSNQYVSAPDSADWAFGSGDFSLALWANFDTVKPGGLGGLPNVFLGQDEGGGSTNKWIFFQGEANKSAFHINTPGGGSFIAATAGAPAVGEWEHYAVTKSGTTYTFYRNGLSVGTAIDTRPIPNASASLTIGQAEGLGFFDGRLDDIRIYNNALSGDDVFRLWNPALQVDDVPEPGVLGLLAGICAAGLIARRGRRR
jgi:hypothetical protein